ncbi:MAG: helix-turn-helix domain-containing protein [Verrucomicrobiota bacterium]|nr:helix-turn-helix domain-containing protein [Verrucomicrobiota bacterium]
MKTSIGSRLTEARERLDLTIEDMATLTRIPAKRIQQIENNDYSLFPNNVYAESFIKLYCNSLKIDFKECFHEIKDLLPPNDQKAVYLNGAAANKDFYDIEEKKIEASSPMSLAVAITLLLIGIPLIVFINSDRGQSAKMVNPELYAPAKFDSGTGPEEESFAETLNTESEQRLPPNSSESSDSLQKNERETKNQKPAPKAIPVEKNPSTRQPVASSSFE